MPHQQPEHFETDPTPPEINQDEVTTPAPLPPLPVTVCDPAPVRLMPARASGWARYALAVGVATRVLSEDMRRKRAVLHVTDTAGASDGAIIGGTQALAGSANGFLLGLPGPGIAAGNVSVIMEYTGTDEVWASASVAACFLNVLNEQWAD